MKRFCLKLSLKKLPLYLLTPEAPPYGTRNKPPLQGTTETTKPETRHLLKPRSSSTLCGDTATTKRRRRETCATHRLRKSRRRLRFELWAALKKRPRVTRYVTEICYTRCLHAMAVRIPCPDEPGGFLGSRRWGGFPGTTATTAPGKEKTRRVYFRPRSRLAAAAFPRTEPVVETPWLWRVWRHTSRLMEPLPKTGKLRNWLTTPRRDDSKKTHDGERWSDGRSAAWISPSTRLAPKRFSKRFYPDRQLRLNLKLPRL